MKYLCLVEARRCFSCFCTMVQLDNDGPEDFLQLFSADMKMSPPLQCDFYWVSWWFNYICQKSSICPYHWYCLWLFYLQHRFHVEGIGFNRTLRRHFVSVFYFNFVFLSLLNCILNVFFAQRTFVICDGYLVPFTCVVIYRLQQKTVVWLWIKTCQAGYHGTDTFINLNKYTELVV